MGTRALPCYSLICLSLLGSPSQGVRVGWGSCAAGPPRGYGYVSPPRMRVSREPRATGTRISLHPITYPPCSGGATTAEERKKWRPFTSKRGRPWPRSMKFGRHQKHLRTRGRRANSHDRCRLCASTAEREAQTVTGVRVYGSVRKRLRAKEASKPYPLRK